MAVDFKNRQQDKNDHFIHVEKLSTIATRLFSDALFEDSYPARQIRKWDFELFQTPKDYIRFGAIDNFISSAIKVEKGWMPNLTTLSGGSSHFQQQFRSPSPSDAAADVNPAAGVAAAKTVAILASSWWMQRFARSLVKCFQRPMPSALNLISSFSGLFYTRKTAAAASMVSVGSSRNSRVISLQYLLLLLLPLLPPHCCCCCPCCCCCCCCAHRSPFVRDGPTAATRKLP